MTAAHSVALIDCRMNRHAVAMMVECSVALMADSKVEEYAGSNGEPVVLIPRNTHFIKIELAAIDTSST